MSYKRVRWTKLALRRLDGIGGYIEKDDPVAAQRVVSRIVSAVDMLAELHNAGRIGRLAGTRELVLPDIAYIIPYRVTQDVEVLTVMHASQQWPKSF